MEGLERQHETEEQRLIEPPQRAFARALGDILDSAVLSYQEKEGKLVSCSVALIGEITKNELSKVLQEMPVIAEIELNKDFGELAVFAFDIPTATRLANFISSGRIDKEFSAGGQPISSLHQFVKPLVASFSGACEEAAGRAFGSLKTINVLDKNEREHLLEGFPDALTQATVLLSAAGEAAGKMAVAIPANMTEIFAESKSSASQVTVSHYERMELEEMDDVDDHFRAYPNRGPSMENIDLILDIQLRLSARLGQVEMPIGEIMKLTPGSVIDIDRLVDEPIELVVNDRPIARGEIVVVQENFGIKITEIISQKERIRSLT